DGAQGGAGAVWAAAGGAATDAAASVRAALPTTNSSPSPPSRAAYRYNFFIANLLDRQYIYYVTDRFMEWGKRPITGWSVPGRHSGGPMAASSDSHRNTSQRPTNWSHQPWPAPRRRARCRPHCSGWGC